MAIRKSDLVIPPLDQQSAAYKLFHYHYLTYMRMADHLHPSEIDVFGLMLSPDANFNAGLSRSLDPRMLTPAEMAHVMAGEGKMIQLNDPKDAVIIYKMIDQHLRDWRDALYDRELTEVPLEGLYEFDQLAAALVLIARGYGLMDEADRQQSYVRRRSLRSAVTNFVPTKGRVTHSGSIFTDILRLCKDSDIDIYQFRHRLNAGESKKKGSL